MMTALETRLSVADGTHAAALRQRLQAALAECRRELARGACPERFQFLQQQARALEGGLGILSQAHRGLSMAQIFNPNPGNTLDTVANALKEQANAANKDVNDAIKALQGTDNADNPALLAELQHKINKWSVIYNINSTVTRALRDLMQGILQKI